MKKQKSLLMLWLICLKKAVKLDAVKLTQLMYLADKYGLTHFGKTITNDEYYATNCCVVGRTAVNLLKSFKK